MLTRPSNRKSKTLKPQTGVITFSERGNTSSAAKCDKITKINLNFIKSKYELQYGHIKIIKHYKHFLCDNVKSTRSMFKTVTLNVSYSDDKQAKY